MEGTGSFNQFQAPWNSSFTPLKLLFQGGETTLTAMVQTRISLISLIY